MRVMRWLALGGIAGAGAYWLMKYWQPQHSAEIFEDAVVLITGASSGIGRAYAHAFAHRGAKIVMAARRADLLEQVHHDIAPYAADVLIVPTDVTDDHQLETLVALTLDQFGGIDFLINNAGINNPGPLYTVSTEKIRQIVSVNLASALCLTRLCLPSMLARGSGWIVNVASVQGRIAFPFEAVYAGTKGGMLHFSDCLRRELDGTGIQVISVLPYWTHSDMIDGPMEQWLLEAGTQVDTIEAVAEGTIDGILKGRHDIVFGGLLAKTGVIVERLFPPLVTAYVRSMVTPDMIAAWRTAGEGTPVVASTNELQVDKRG